MHVPICVVIVETFEHSVPLNWHLVWKSFSVIPKNSAIVAVNGTCLMIRPDASIITVFDVVCWMFPVTLLVSIASPLV